MQYCILALLSCESDAFRYPCTSYKALQGFPRKPIRHCACLRVWVYNFLSQFFLLLSFLELRMPRDIFKMSQDFFPRVILVYILIGKISLKHSTNWKVSVCFSKLREFVQLILDLFTKLSEFSQLILSLFIKLSEFIQLIYSS